MNNENNFFSVIIPTYNREKVLFRAINSVMNQTFFDFDLWIIDDGSTDATEHLVNEYRKHHPLREKIFYQKIENQGVSAARNVGIQISEGRWLAFLDSDDEWLPDKLYKQRKFIDERPDIKIVHGEEIWIRNGVRVNPKKIHQKYGGVIYKLCLPLCRISPSAAVIERQMLLSMGNFDEDFTVCEDYFLWLKITSLFEVGFITDPLIKKYGGHEDQLSHKYHSMDYYRVKAMHKILMTRNLSEDDRQATLKELIAKCEILIAGYLKHNNLKNLEEIKIIYDHARNQLKGMGC